MYDMGIAVFKDFLYKSGLIRNVVDGMNQMVKAWRDGLTVEVGVVKQFCTMLMDLVKGIVG